MGLPRPSVDEESAVKVMMTSLNAGINKLDEGELFFKFCKLIKTTYT
jgi:hypothetical protein